MCFGVQHSCVCPPCLGVQLQMPLDSLCLALLSSVTEPVFYNKSETNGDDFFWQQAVHLLPLSAHLVSHWSLEEARRQSISRAEALVILSYQKSAHKCDSCSHTWDLSADLKCQHLPLSEPFLNFFLLPTAMSRVPLNFSLSLSLTQLHKAEGEVQILRGAGK